MGLSVVIASVPGLLDLLRGAAYLSKKLCRVPRVVESLTAVDVFNELGLSNLKNNAGGFNVRLTNANTHKAAVSSAARPKPPTKLVTLAKRSTRTAAGGRSCP